MSDSETIQHLVDAYIKRLRAFCYVFDATGTLTTYNEADSDAFTLLRRDAIAHQPHGTSKETVWVTREVAISKRG